MKKIFFYSLLSASILLLLVLFLPHKVHVPEKEGGPANPGWEAQFYRMKKNELGEVPKGVIRRLRQQAQFNKTSGAPVLSNVTEVGPGNVGGRTRAFLVDKANTSRFLSGGVSGGLWESTNSGTTWSPINDAAPTLSVTYVAQDPNNTNNIYFCTGEPRGNSTGIDGDGVYKSTDGGSTFSKLASTAGASYDDCWVVKVSPAGSDVVYVGTEGSGLFKSTDGGSSFTNVLMGDITDIELFTDGSVMATRTGDGIWSSASGDAGTFSKLSGGLPTSGFSRIEIAYCDSFPSTIYAQFEDGSGGYWSDLLDVYKTTNGGTSWSAVANPASTLGAYYSFPWYCFMFEVSPSNPDVIVSGSVEMTFSTNGGTSWDNGSYSHADYHIAVFDPVNHDKVYVGNDGGIHDYNVSTMSWGSTSLNNGYNVTQFYAGAFFPTGINALGGTQDNGTQRFMSGGATTYHVFGGDGAFCQVNQQAASISYVSYQNGNIQKATDTDVSTYPSYNDVMGEMDADFNGSIDDGAWFINPFEINLLDGDQLYFPTDTRVWRTTNGASNWTPLTNTLSNSPYSVGISNSTSPTVYIGGDGILYRVDNATSATPGSEVNLTTGLPTGLSGHFISSIEVHATDPGTIYLSLSNYSWSSSPRIWKVTNANTASPSYTSIHGDLPAEMVVNWVEADPAKPDSNLFIATDFGLYSTTNGGVNWQKETDIPNVSIHNIRLRNTDRKLFVFTHGRGMWTGDLPLISGNETPVRETVVKVYPNPATEYIKVDARGDWNAFLYDLKGAQVGSMHSSDLQMDLSGIDRGVYILKVFTSEGESVHKLIRN